MDAKELEQLLSLCAAAAPGNYISNDQCYVWLERLAVATPQLIEEVRRLETSERECKVLRAMLLAMVRAMQAQGGMDPVVTRAMQLLARMDLNTMEGQLLMDALTQPVEDPLRNGTWF